MASFPSSVTENDLWAEEKLNDLNNKANGVLKRVWSTVIEAELYKNLNKKDETSGDFWKPLPQLWDGLSDVSAAASVVCSFHNKFKDTERCNELLSSFQAAALYANESAGALGKFTWNVLECDIWKVFWRHKDFYPFMIRLSNLFGTLSVCTLQVFHPQSACVCACGYAHAYICVSDWPRIHFRDPGEMISVLASGISSASAQWANGWARLLMLNKATCLLQSQPSGINDLREADGENRRDLQTQARSELKCVLGLEDVSLLVPASTPRVTRFHVPEVKWMFYLRFMGRLWGLFLLIV